jgi:hypothetical protein
MKRRLVAVLMGALIALSTVGTAFADKPHGPNPQPPKCTPANSPGCS